MGTVTANPERYTGCGKPSGATLLAAPRSSLDAEQHGPFGDHCGGGLGLAPTRAAFDAAAPRDGDVAAALPIHGSRFPTAYRARAASARVRWVVPSQALAAVSKAATPALPNGPSRASVRRLNRNLPAAATRFEPALAIATQPLHRRTERWSRGQPRAQIRDRRWNGLRRQRAAAGPLRRWIASATRNGPRPWLGGDQAFALAVHRPAVLVDGLIGEQRLDHRNRERSARPYSGPWWTPAAATGCAAERPASCRQRTGRTS